MANPIQIKRGAKATLPTLAAGEPAFCTDTHELYLGTGSVNYRQGPSEENFTTTLKDKLDGVEASADVTDATNVNAAGALMNNDFNATTFMYATSDNTPEVKTRAEVMAILSGQNGADFSMNTHKITNVTDPTSSQDAATKSFVEAFVYGLDRKESVHIATTIAGTLSTSFADGQTIDGITLVTGDRILIKDQASGSENGIYTVNASGAPTRSIDADEDSEVTAGLYCMVEEGTANADYGFILTTNNPITVGTTSLAFANFARPGSAPSHATTHQNGGSDEINIGGLSGLLADDQHVLDSEVTAVAVARSIFDVNTILKADSDNTPIALSVGASTFVGRKASGNISAMSVAEALILLGVESGADVTDATNVDAAGALMNNDFNATTFMYATSDNTPEVKTRTEVMAILNGQNGADFSMNTHKITAVTDPSAAQDAATKNFCETRTIDGGTW